ncbi:MAG: DUF3540 domain-containing protein [Deltaproteobacteria bacterium]|jgi:hypothetical protein|nr:DUF3540 domain-containing protein [Deltaproteobacteria bacterium]
MNRALQQAGLELFEKPFLAEVLAVTDGQFRILAQGQILKAQKAFSCLLEPQKGDLVALVAAYPSERSYILGILERSDPGDALAGAQLALPPQTEIRGQDLALNLSHLAVTSQRIQARATQANFSGQWLKLDFSLFQCLAKRALSVMGSFWGRFGRWRSTAEISHLQAERMTLKAEKTLVARAGSLDLKAEAAARIDGQTIELG